MSYQKALFFLLILIPLLAEAKTKPAKNAAPSLEDRFEKACAKLVKDAPKNSAKETCACLTRNMKETLDAKEFLLLTRTYEGDKKAESELEKKEHAGLQNFDVDLAENCLENPNFKVEK
jgi:hypothetical protein